MCLDELQISIMFHAMFYTCRYSFFSNLLICLSNKFPDDVDPGTML